MSEIIEVPLVQQAVPIFLGLDGTGDGGVPVTIPLASSLIAGIIKTTTDTPNPIVYVSSVVDTLINSALGGKAASGANSDITSLSGLFTPLSIAQGGSGSTFKNFVDLTTAQSIAGIKTYTSSPIIPYATTATQAASFAQINKSNVGLSQVENALQLVTFNNLSDLTNKPTARTNLGLTAIAQASYGSIVGTVCQGNDTRLTDARTPIGHQHPIGDVTNLQTSLDGKAAAIHSHVSTSITDFSEAVDDRVASLLVAGLNISLTYDDVANTISIASSGGGTSYTDEQVDDRVAALIVAGTGISKTYDDIANTLTLNATGGGAVPDASSTVKGVIQLAGDMGGTAALPTVPGLANKVDTSDSRLSDSRNPLVHTQAFSTITGTVPIPQGGTGIVTTPTNGQLLIGNGTSYSLATLTAGTNVTITNSSGGISIASTASGGGGDPTYVKTGVFYSGFTNYYQSNLSVSWSAGTVKMIPFIAQYTGTLLNLGVFVSTAGASTSTQYNFAIYDNLPTSNYPGNRLSTISTTTASSGGLKGSNAMGQALVKGTLYWLGINSHYTTGTAGSTVVGVSVNSSWAGLSATFTAIYSYVVSGQSTTVAYAYPATFAAGATGDATIAVPLVGFKYS